MSSDTGEWPAAGILLATATTATLATTLFFSAILWPSSASSRWRQVLPNPLKTLPIDARSESMKGLVYQDNQFPGQRDVDTPYGNVRVYEFGPEDGQKVLLIHGISTPCITMGPIAQGLVARGCRVLLYDLFGRGFSDGVGDLPHDARLYVSQILLVLASSPLCWTGSRAAIHVLGYSLGGGIAVHFAGAVPPGMISSLVLLAPAGLIRAESFGRLPRFLFRSGLVPDQVLAFLTRRRLQQPIARNKDKKEEVELEVAAAELADPPPGEDATPLEHRVMHYVRWMVRHHVGFVPAFMSSVRHAPLTGQHEAWARLAERPRGSTVVMLAERDEIIDAAHTEEDALSLVGGKENVHWRILPGGHDFVMTYTNDILVELEDIWGMRA